MTKNREKPEKIAPGLYGYRDYKIEFWEGHWKIILPGAKEPTLVSTSKLCAMDIIDSLETAKGQAHES